jgi:hypothetical protein
MRNSSAALCKSHECLFDRKVESTGDSSGLPTTSTRSRVMELGVKYFRDKGFSVFGFPFCPHSRCRDSLLFSSVALVP